MTQKPRTRIPARCQRRAAPRCRGGVSSLLRLAQPITPQLPSPGDVGGWVERAARAFAIEAA